MSVRLHGACEWAFPNRTPNPPHTSFLFSLFSDASDAALLFVLHTTRLPPSGTALANHFT